MVALCLYFQVHQPNRLKQYSYFDIGKNHNYEDDEKNRDILLKVANKCYLPTNALLLKLLKKYNGDFKISFSLSGIAIEQFKRFSQETLDSFKRLYDTGYVELLNETYYHSLSYIFSESEFLEQINLHKELLKKEFGCIPTTFRNTELVYDNKLGQLAERLGYKCILAEGADKVLGWRSPNFIYHPEGCSDIKLLLKNYRLSDDVAFRFSDRSWSEFPLTIEKYAQWVNKTNGNGEIINLFMDFETFGEHQWADTGIFSFLESLPSEILKNPDNKFITPFDASQTLNAVASIDIPYVISWADTDRDLTAWYGNSLQKDALTAVYSLEKKVKMANNQEMTKIWRSLLTSDHFYYMCTKYANDGDVHKYFNPYNNPYEAYINYQNILCDFEMELNLRY